MCARALKGLEPLLPLLCVLVDVSFGLAEVLLDLALKLLGATLDVLAGVVSRVAEIATNLAFHFLGGSLDLILESALFEVLTHIFLRSAYTCNVPPPCAAHAVNAMGVPVPTGHSAHLLKNLR